jgi:hypothetical protein
LNDGQLARENFVWIDSLDLRTRPDVDLAELENGNDFVAELLKAFKEYEEDPAKLQALFGDIDATFVSPEAQLSLPEDSGSITFEILEAAKWKLIDAFVTN